MARIWRPGQTRPVHLYRLVTAGGLEERIFQRQAAKLALTSQALLNPILSQHKANQMGNLKKVKCFGQGVLTRDELKVRRCMCNFRYF